MTAHDRAARHRIAATEALSRAGIEVPFPRRVLSQHAEVDDAGGDPDPRV